MRFRLLNDMVSPLAIALNAIPIIVLVSVFNNMFAITSEIPRRLMVTLVVYFIVLVNVAKGLRQVAGRRTSSCCGRTPRRRRRCCARRASRTPCRSCSRRSRSPRRTP